MRSGINQAFLKVEGHDSLIRDMTSNAIISTNNDEYESYKRRNENAKKNSKIMLKQINEIDTLKNEVKEIKEMLVQILKGK